MSHCLALSQGLLLKGMLIIFMLYNAQVKKYYMEPFSIERLDIMKLL